MLRKLTRVGLICAALGFSTATAQAHPRLQAATPAPGAALTNSPSAIRMRFSEGIIGRFTGLTLMDTRGKRVPTGSATVDPIDNTKLMVPIKVRLIAGTYNVAWHAVSVDTHRIAGKFKFRVTR